MTATDIATTDQIHYLPLDQLHEVEHNRAVGDISDLAESIGLVGILEPIEVRTRPAGGYEIVFGARRTAAARLAGLDTIRATINDERTDDEVELARLLENIHRLDPSALEEAESYERLIQHHGMTAEQVAAAASRSPSHVSKRRSLLVLPDPAKAALTDGRINIQTALGMTALARDTKRMDAVVDALPDADASGDRLERERQELDRRIADEIRDRAMADKISTKRIELDAAGETVIDYPPNGQWSSTEYRVCRDGEAHQAVAITTDYRGDVQVVNVTSAPVPEARRHHPPKPEGDVGFVEQARRERARDAEERTAARRAVAHEIFDAPGLDAELTTFVFDTVLGFCLGDEPPIDYGHGNIIRDLLGLAEDADLIDYAARTSLTRLRAAAAAVMASTEVALRQPRMSKLPPGAWAPITAGSSDDAGETDENGDRRRYLRLLERHGYEIPADELAAILPVSDGNQDTDA